MGGALGSLCFSIVYFLEGHACIYVCGGVRPPLLRKNIAMKIGPMLRYVRLIM